MRYRLDKNDIILSVTNLSKFYKKKKILNNINIEIIKGEIVGLIGPNGSGKSTTLKIISGFVFPDMGNVEINGISVFKKSSAALKQIGVLIESPQFYPYLTAYENLDIICSISNIEKSRIAEVIDLVGLSTAVNVKTKEFSQGMKQRLGIAQAVLIKPNFIILDEPTNSLDHHGIREFKKLISELREIESITFLISSNNLHEIEKICDRIILIYKGEIIVDRLTQKLLKNHTSSLEELFANVTGIGN